MVSPEIPTIRAHVLRIRCPRFIRCKARLCPLEPFPSEKEPLPDEELCYFYTKGDPLEHLDEIPWFLFAPLLDYARRLAEIGLVVENQGQSET